MGGNHRVNILDPFAGPRGTRCVCIYVVQVTKGELTMCLKEVTTVKVRCAKSSIPGDTTVRAVELGPFRAQRTSPPYTTNDQPTDRSCARKSECHACHDLMITLQHSSRRSSGSIAQEGVSVRVHSVCRCHKVDCPRIVCKRWVWGVENVVRITGTRPRYPPPPPGRNFLMHGNFLLSETFRVILSVCRLCQWVRPLAQRSMTHPVRKTRISDTQTTVAQSS